MTGLTTGEQQSAADRLFVLAQLLRGHGYTAELIGSRRLQVRDGSDSPGVEIRCHPRRGDADRLWFSWGSGIWMCEADNPTDALVQIKAALHRATQGSAPS